MPDPVALSASASASAHAQAPQPQRLDAAETRMFARMLQGAAEVPAGNGSVQDAAKAYAAQLSGHVRSNEEMRHSMLESIDLSDPVKTMFALTDHAMQAQMVFARLHISTALASSATSLFGTLLRNQQ